MSNISTFYTFSQDSSNHEYTINAGRRKNGYVSNQVNKINGGFEDPIDFWNKVKTPHDIPDTPSTRKPPFPPTPEIPKSIQFDSPIDDQQIEIHHTSDEENETDEIPFNESKNETDFTLNDSSFMSQSPTPKPTYIPMKDTPVSFKTPNQMKSNFHGRNSRKDSTNLFADGMTPAINKAHADKNKTQIPKVTPYSTPIQPNSSPIEEPKNTSPKFTFQSNTPIRIPQATPNKPQSTKKQVQISNNQNQVQQTTPKTDNSSSNNLYPPLPENNLHSQIQDTFSKFLNDKQNYNKQNLNRKNNIYSTRLNQNPYDTDMPMVNKVTMDLYNDQKSRKKDESFQENISLYRDSYNNAGVRNFRYGDRYNIISSSDEEDIIHNTNRLDDIRSQNSSDKLKKIIKLNQDFVSKEDPLIKAKFNRRQSTKMSDDLHINVQSRPVSTQNQNSSKKDKIYHFDFSNYQNNDSLIPNRQNLAKPRNTNLLKSLGEFHEYSSSSPSSSDDEINETKHDKYNHNYNFKRPVIQSPDDYQDIKRLLPNRRYDKNDETQGTQKEYNADKIYYPTLNTDEITRQKSVKRLSCSDSNKVNNSHDSDYEYSSDISESITNNPSTSKKTHNEKNGNIFSDNKSNDENDSDEFDFTPPLAKSQDQNAKKNFKSKFGQKKMSQINQQAKTDIIPNQKSLAQTQNNQKKQLKTSHTSFFQKNSKPINEQQNDSEEQIELEPEEQDDIKDENYANDINLTKNEIQTQKPKKIELQHFHETQVNEAPVFRPSTPIQNQNASTFSANQDDFDSENTSKIKTAIKPPQRKSRHGPEDIKDGIFSFDVDKTGIKDSDEYDDDDDISDREKQSSKLGSNLLSPIKTFKSILKKRANNSNSPSVMFGTPIDKKKIERPKPPADFPHLPISPAPDINQPNTPSPIRSSNDDEETSDEILFQESFINPEFQNNDEYPTEMFSTPVRKKLTLAELEQNSIKKVQNSYYLNQDYTIKQEEEEEEKSEEMHNQNQIEEENEYSDDETKKLKLIEEETKKWKKFAVEERLKKQQEEEEERLKKQQEEEEERQKKLQEEEEERLKKLQEEEEERLKKLQEEEEKRQKKLQEKEEERLRLEQERLKQEEEREREIQKREESLRQEEERLRKEEERLRQKEERIRKEDEKQKQKEADNQAQIENQDEKQNEENKEKYKSKVPYHSTSDDSESLTEMHSKAFPELPPSSYNMQTKKSNTITDTSTLSPIESPIPSNYANDFSADELPPLPSSPQDSEDETSNKETNQNNDSDEDLELNIRPNKDSNSKGGRKNVSKTQKKIQKNALSPSLIDNYDPDFDDLPIALRRTKRPRTQPLRHWLNEKIIYKPAPNGCLTQYAVQTGVENLDEIDPLSPTCVETIESIIKESRKIQKKKSSLTQDSEVIPKRIIPGIENSASTIISFKGIEKKTIKSNEIEILPKKSFDLDANNKKIMVVFSTVENAQIEYRNGKKWKIKAGAQAYVCKGDFATVTNLSEEDSVHLFVLYL